MRFVSPRTGGPWFATGRCCTRPRSGRAADGSGGSSLLRGPGRHSGEAAARTERMADFAGIDEVESDLQGLAGPDAPGQCARPAGPARSEGRRGPNSWKALADRLAYPIQTAPNRTAPNQTAPNHGPATNHTRLNQTPLTQTPATQERRPTGDGAQPDGARLETARPETRPLRPDGAKPTEARPANGRRRGSASRSGGPPPRGRRPSRRGVGPARRRRDVARGRCALVPDRLDDFDAPARLTTESFGLSLWGRGTTPRITPWETRASTTSGPPSASPGAAGRARVCRRRSNERGPSWPRGRLPLQRTGFASIP